MKNLFLDTNIIIDVIDYRMPFYTKSAKIFDYGAKGFVNLFMSSLSFATIYYVAKKTISHQECIKVMKDLSSLITTVDVTGEVINLSINSSFNDFEDALQYYSALAQGNITAIVTRNSQDFKQSDIPIMNPEQALAMIL
ncbi:type II toxin-antitoxin system VapC family toxin [Pedobacter endophyticus]|uniref:PIN domain-containing protein n=1 Tax=Pedobacter endophyticus TaxID=2789740 RepID=A0A7S9L2F0_9SPHI|nr:PIN domain-containing protein [Pedobacter endophyticus]QPH41203.1 PIN domain-containing protein [Pedobacter endophyticus]